MSATSFVTEFDRLQAQHQLDDALGAAGLSSGAQPHAAGDGDAARLDGIRAYLQRTETPIEGFAATLECHSSVAKALLETPSIIPAEARVTLIDNALTWIAGRERERELRQAAVVPTPITKAIVGLARAVYATKTMGLVVGGAGLGKSAALAAVAAELPRVIVVRVGVDTRHARGLLRAIGRAASCDDPVRRGGPSWSVAAGLESIRRGGALLVLDEAQRCSPWALEGVRDVLDAGWVGVLLIGTRALGRHVDPQHDPAVGPLASRIALRCGLDVEILGRGRPGRQWIDARSVRAIIARHVAAELDADAARMLAEVANGDAYHLRAAMDLGRVAGHLAHGRSTITGTDVRHAQSLRGRA